MASWSSNPVCRGWQWSFHAMPSTCMDGWRDAEPMNQTDRFESNYFETQTKGDLRERSTLANQLVGSVHLGVTWNLKMELGRTMFLYNPVVFRFHVKRPGCTSSESLYGATGASRVFIFDLLGPSLRHNLSKTLHMTTCRPIIHCTISTHTSSSGA